MRVAIMQPYFLPYIGYFQLISSVDLFVVYDNIKYTKKGWINRNRMLQNDTDVMFSLPLTSGSDALDVRQRELARDFNREKLLGQIESAYRRAPYFLQTFALIQQIVRQEERNLFGFLHYSIVKICEYLEIATKIIISSSISIDHDLKGQQKVLALCDGVGATTYVNTIGGLDLYSKDDFSARGIQLKFIRSNPFEYVQFGKEFVPWLSIIDVLMFNPIDIVRERIASNYELV